MTKDITLVAIEFQWHDLTRYAIERSLENIDPKEIVIISDQEILPGARHIQHDPVANLAEYAKIMTIGVGEHVNTEHALYVQWDGIANDRSLWSDDFLVHDYIGAVWPWEPAGRNVGNGGFSLRSKRFLDACANDTVKLGADKTYLYEDKLLCNDLRPYMEETYGIRYAPATVAQQFSFELGKHVPSFGFHGLWNVFNLMTDADMDYFMTRIDYKGWNHFKWHHVLAAVLRRERYDIYEYMVNQLTEHNPELLEAVASWIERDGNLANSPINID